MAVQYTAQASTRIGGAGSGSLNTGARGPTKTILIGYIMWAKVRFQAIGESIPGNQSPFTGTKSKLEITRKTNAETRKTITNFFLEIFILLSFLQLLKSTLKYKVKSFILYFNAFKGKLRRLQRNVRLCSENGMASRRANVQQLGLLQGWPDIGTIVILSLSTPSGLDKHRRAFVC